MPLVEPPPVDRGGILSWFSPDPPAPVTETDPVAVRSAFRSWQARILFASTAGYAVFYFVRVNLPVAMPAMKQELKFSYTQLGLFLTAHGVVYGVSKFLNGFLGDRCNARTFMATGLILSAIMNFAFGMSSVAWVMGTFWVLNGYFQGMGFPPCARLLTHWFKPKQLATKMSIWNSSHSIGASVITLLCGALVIHGWRLCFIVPAVIAAITAGLLLVFLRDTPQSLGLPDVEQLEDDEERAADPVAVAAVAESSSAASGAVGTLEYETAQVDPHLTARQLVFANPYIWLVSVANFLVYTIRYAILSWAPTFLSQNKGIQLTHAAWISAGYELAGVCGALLAGYVTDRVFGGKAIRASVIYMICCGVALFLFWRSPHPSELTATVLIAAIGFCIYGPQCLIGVAAANLATRKAAATAVGLTGLFGYASTVLSGWGLGALVQHYGWDRGFLALLFVAAAAVVVFLAAWGAPADGYGKAAA